MGKFREFSMIHGTKLTRKQISNFQLDVPPWKIAKETKNDLLALRQHVLLVHGTSLLYNMIRAKHSRKIRL